MMDKTCSFMKETVSKIHSENVPALLKILADNAKARETLRRENALIARKIIARYAGGGTVATLIAVYP